VRKVACIFVSWWREGVFYEIYPRSFCDSDGDGVGDLPGVTSRLDYLRDLGVVGIWLNPTFPSPNVDWGYDVSDYRGVHPELGTLEDLDELIREARQRGIRILLDLVPNHTSDRHPWFAERPEYYVWSDEVPNNWTSAFAKGSAWSRDEQRGRYYLHNFAREQPDLDWWNPEVRAQFEKILRFWFDRGIAGFRIDVAHGLVKDRELRDNRVYAEGDPEWVKRWGHWNDRSMNQPETHEIFREWQRIAREYDPKPIFVGETYVTDIPQLVTYYGNGEDELDLCFNFAFVHAPFEAEALREIVEATEAYLPPRAWPVWTASNHDVGRLATHWAGGDERKARAALFILLTLRGTPFLYAGDELALPDGEVPPDRIVDVADPSRDPGRTPIPWTRSGEEWRDPWLPLVDTSRNVEDQLADPGSTLNYVRGLVEERKPFVREPYESLPSPPGVWAWRRGPFTLVVNLTDHTAGFEGRTLDPWQGVIAR
jgi:alpha-glucosidase